LICEQSRPPHVEIIHRGPLLGCILWGRGKWPGYYWIHRP